MSNRYHKDQIYLGKAGPHKQHRIRVLWTKPAGDFYDVVRVACAERDCLKTWRFLHLWRPL